MKIRIIGGPGSGKTYAAKKISRLLNIPHFGTDEMHFHKDDTNFTKINSNEVQLEMVRKVLKRKKWIVEGTGYRLSSETIRQADVVVVLDVTVFLRSWRITSRTIKRWLGMRKKSESLLGFLKFFKWNYLYDGKYMDEFRRKFKSYSKKTHSFTKADDAIAYFR